MFLPGSFHFHLVYLHLTYVRYLVRYGGLQELEWGFTIEAWFRRPSRDSLRNRRRGQPRYDHPSITNQQHLPPQHLDQYDHHGDRHSRDKSHLLDRGSPLLFTRKQTNALRGRRQRPNLRGATTQPRQFGNKRFRRDGHRNSSNDNQRVSDTDRRDNLLLAKAYKRVSVRNGASTRHLSTGVSTVGRRRAQPKPFLFFTPPSP